MNLLRFTLRTAKALIAIPLVFGYGTWQQANEGDPKAAAIVGLSGLSLLLLSLILTAQHRRTLDRRNVQAYVRQLIHNKNTHPFTLPDEQWAVDRVGKIFDQPLEP